MKIFLLGFYIVFVSLSYGVEEAKPLSRKMLYCKQKRREATETERPLIFPEKKVDCNLKYKKITISNEESSLKNHILTVKKFRDSINKTIEEIANKNPSSSQIAKIVFDISNLINNIDLISQSDHLDKVTEVINQSDSLEQVSDIYELLCKVKNFLHIFSLSFIEDTVTDLPVKNEFQKKIDSDWFKEGFLNLTKYINILEKFVELESCREDIMSFLPLLEKNHNEIAGVISKMLTTTSATFLHELSEFLDFIEHFNGLLKQIETNTCLLNSKGITQAQEIVSLAKGLNTYFLDLFNKLKEALEEVKTIENMECYNCKSDAFVQDVIHEIFLCKHNKMFYKQMNNDFNKLLTLIKGLEEIKE